MKLLITLVKCFKSPILRAAHKNYFLVHFKLKTGKALRLKDATKCAKEEGRKKEGDGLLRQRRTWSIAAVFENEEEEAESGSPNDPKNLKKHPLKPYRARLKGAS